MRFLCELLPLNGAGDPMVPCVIARCISFVPPSAFVLNAAASRDRHHKTYTHCLAASTSVQSLLFRNQDAHLEELIAQGDEPFLTRLIDDYPPDRSGLEILIRPLRRMNYLNSLKIRPVMSRSEICRSPPRATIRWHFCRKEDLAISHCNDVPEVLCR
jgi:hypothetical protein